MSSDIYIPLRIVLSHLGQFELKAELDGCTHGAYSELGEENVDWDYIQSQLKPVLLCKIGARETWRVADVIINRPGEEAKLHICCGNSYAHWLIHWLNDHNYEYTMAEDPRDRRYPVLIGDHNHWLKKLENGEYDYTAIHEVIEEMVEGDDYVVFKDHDHTATVYEQDDKHVRDIHYSEVF